jgi:hypothetical protein
LRGQKPVFKRFGRERFTEGKKLKGCRSRGRERKKRSKKKKGRETRRAKGAPPPPVQRPSRRRAIRTSMATMGAGVLVLCLSACLVAAPARAQKPYNTISRTCSIGVNENTNGGPFFLSLFSAVSLLLTLQFGVNRRHVVDTYRRRWMHRGASAFVQGGSKSQLLVVSGFNFQLPPWAENPMATATVNCRRGAAGMTISRAYFKGAQGTSQVMEYDAGIPTSTTTL